MGGVKGSGKAEAQLLPVECTYETCQQRFHTVKDMKKHKQNFDDHNYCKKCDVDCDSWDALTQHKADAMRPWLDKRKRAPTTDPPHIVCEFCGEDFKSWGGRDGHRRQLHKAAQHIVCEGCKGVFTKASNLVYHLERNECSAISATAFHKASQQRHINNQIWQDPDIIQANLDKARIAYAGVDRDEGGVSLLDHQDEAQKEGFTPLQAEVDLLSSPISEAWPCLAQITKSTASMSIRPKVPAVTERNSSGSSSASQATSRRGGMKVCTESNASLGSLGPWFSDDGEETSDTASQSQSTTTAGSLVSGPAWTTGRTSNNLFKGAKPTPPPAVGAAALVDNSRSLTDVRFWDPSSPDYHPDVFFQPAIEKYCCPFPACESVAFDVPSDMARHLYSAHIHVPYICQICWKRFKSASGFCAHLEDVEKCRVRQSDIFHKLLASATGGYVGATRVPVPAVYNMEQSVVKAGKNVATGVMDMKYEGKKPEKSSRADPTVPKW